MAETQDTELLSVPQVARRLNVSKPTVYRRISDGWIPALRIGDGCGPIPCHYRCEDTDGRPDACDQCLRRLLLAGEGQPNVALDHRHRRQLSLGRPPCRTPVEYLLLRRGVDDLPRAGRDRPLLGCIEVLKCRPVLPLEDVLGHDVDANVVFVCHEEEKAWRGNLEIDHDRIGIGRAGLFHRLLHVHTPAHLGAEIAQRVEGVGDVFGGERHAVAPGDTGAGCDRQALEIGGELILLGKPHIGLVGERAVIRERLVDEVGAVLVVGADRVRVPKVPIDPSALAAAGPDQDNRAVSRNLREIGPRALPRQDSGHTRENAGFDQVAPVEMTGRRIIGHLTGISSWPLRRVL